jgi:hypothetical protein
MTHTDLTLVALDWLIRRNGIGYALPEVALPGDAGRPDAVGFDCDLFGDHKAPADLWAIEAKNVRVNLEQDLRSGKMLRYATVASRCVLLVNESAVDIPARARRTSEADGLILAKLGALGLPDDWGVILQRVNRSGVPYTVSVIRKSTRLRSLWVGDVVGIAAEAIRTVCRQKSRGL